MVRSRIVQDGQVGYGIRLCMAWFGTVQYGAVWCDAAQGAMVECGML